MTCVNRLNEQDVFEFETLTCDSKTVSYFNVQNKGKQFLLATAIY